ncbi:hypothetical protein Tco_1006716 [Tanacetum coccineum]|uniref:Uncharacterized protein n=1 Tax=Tanacetum coccineum TaxID=301880 RepID=A0ABQ5FJV0_9ASTR
MASTVICLTTNQKFYFSMYIFDNMVKNLEGGVKFLMYPRFVQVFLDKQVEGMSKHKEIYVTPSHTKKVFANMKRQRKDFSGRDAPLFATMIVQAQEQVGEGSQIPTDSHHTPTTTQPSTSKPQKKQSRRKQRKDNKDPQLSGPTEPVTDSTDNVTSVPTHSNDPLLSGEDRLKLNELMELCTKLSERVLALETIKTNQALDIDSLKKRVNKLKKKKRSRTHRLRRLYKIGRSAQVVSSEDEGRYGDNLMFDTGVLDNEQDMAEKSLEIKAAKPKARGVIVQEPSEFTTTTSPSQPSQLPQAKDKGKAKMKKRGLARQREEDANIVEWDNVQAMMDADYELAARLQAEEQGELTIEEKSRLFVELMNKRKKHFARLRAEKKTTN